MSGATGQLAAASVCPDCGTVIPVDEGFSPWCEQCGWNVDPLSDPEPDGRSAVLRFYFGAGQRLARRLFDDLCRRRSLITEGVLRPRPGLAYGVALVIAVAVMLVPVASAALGLAFLAGFPNPLMLLLGFLFLGIGWVIRPRIGRAPRATFGREDLPRLYALLDRVADSLQTPRIEGVLFATAFNTGTSASGWRRRRILILGLPLWRTLEGQQKVALLGHELGHHANGDPLRDWAIHTSIESLVELHRLLLPEWAGRSRAGLPSFMRKAYPLESLFAVPVEVVQYAVAQLILGVAYVQLLLVWRASQRAEYLADVKAASVAGNRGMVGCLESFALDGIFNRIMSGAAMGDPSRDCFAELDRLIGARPPREVERARLLVRRTTSRSDNFHPPTAFRIDLLAARADTAALVVLTGSDEAAIEAELEPYYRSMSHEIVEIARDRLYA